MGPLNYFSAPYAGQKNSFSSNVVSFFLPADIFMHTWGSSHFGCVLMMIFFPYSLAPSAPCPSPPVLQQEKEQETVSSINILSVRYANNLWFAESSSASIYSGDCEFSAAAECGECGWWKRMMRHSHTIQGDFSLLHSCHCLHIQLFFHQRQWCLYCLYNK